MNSWLEIIPSYRCSGSASRHGFSTTFQFHVVNLIVSVCVRQVADVLLLLVIFRSWPYMCGGSTSGRVDAVRALEPFLRDHYGKADRCFGPCLSHVLAKHYASAVSFLYLVLQNFPLLRQFTPAKAFIF